MHLDFETRSVVDLRKFGLDVYANSPTTDAWCMSFAFDDEPIERWRMGEELPTRVREHVELGRIVVGHNVRFEWYIWNKVIARRYDWPELKIEQCDCTMAKSYSMALPGALEKLSIALGVGEKDMEGHALMLKMCKPRKIEEDGTLIWWDAEELQLRQMAYCDTDVEMERACDKYLLPLSPTERALWLLDHDINQRGIGVDRQAVEVSQAMVERVKKILNQQMKEATDGTINAVTEATKILAWCQDSGIEIESLNKYAIDEQLNKPHLPSEVREILELRSNAKASVTKLQTALDMSLVDSRVRGAFQFYGATTGRWAGRGVQFHNLPRPEKGWDDPAFQHRMIEGIISGDIDEEFIAEWFGPPMRVLSSCIRGYFVPAPGFEFVGADLKNIEGVALAWLAGEEWKLTAFRENFFNDGPGIYELGASRILGIEVDEVSKEERQVWGKVPELSMGYQGGVGAFQQMAVNYGVCVPDSRAEVIKLSWRDLNRKIKQYWYDVEEAAVKAVANPGLKCYAGAKDRQVCFRIAGSFLWCKLPSGRVICYPFPELQEQETPWGALKNVVTFMTMDSRVKSKTKGKYVRMSSYGGKFVENITQAVARDILAHGMFLVEKAGYPIVLHVHDENISEVERGYGSVTEYEKLMSTNPIWAKDLPLAAEGFRGVRYRK